MSVGKQKLTQDQWIQQAHKVHGLRYDYSHVEYTGCHTKVEIICKIHGPFTQRPYAHTANKSGCPSCKWDQKHKLHMMSTEIFVQRAHEVHDGIYDYSLVNYINNRTKVRIVCKIHGPFDQVPMSHSKGVGCPSCGQTISKGERKIKRFLDHYDIPYSYQQRFDDCVNPVTNRTLPFDFFLSEDNILIEYDGEHHFRPVIFSNNPSDIDRFTEYHERVVKNDMTKNKYAEEKGIQLIRIPFNTNIDQTLDHITKKGGVRRRKGTLLR